MSKKNVKIDSYNCHEALDRTAMLTAITEEFVLNHPAVTQNPKIKKKVEKAMEILWDAYQDISNLPEYNTELSTIKK